MTDVLTRCRRLGFPPFIKTDKKIGDLDPVTLLWLFYYLLEIYEPTWSHSPKAFTKSNYKPLSTAMRLLELAHKCPKSKELKRPNEYKRSISSSLGCILDKLEARYGKNKLYSTRFQHPSIKGMQQIQKSKQNKINKSLNINNNLNKNKNVNNENICNKNIQQQIQISQIPRASSKDIISTSYECKQEEIADNTPKYHTEEKAMECVIETNAKMNINNNGRQDIVMKEYCEVNKGNNNMNMNLDYKRCDLNVYNIKGPNFQNETVKFHIKIQSDNNNLSMTEKYEQLQQKQLERMKEINKMKEEYNKIANDLNRCYSFRAKPFQDTSSTDYALFQLESIKQKFKSQQELKNEKCIELMDEDGIDDLLKSISDEVQRWGK